MECVRSSSYKRGALLNKRHRQGSNWWYEDDKCDDDDDEKDDNDDLMRMVISKDNDIAHYSYENSLPSTDVIQYIRMSLLHSRVMSKYRILRYSW